MPFELTNKWCLQRAQLAWRQKTLKERFDFLMTYYVDRKNPQKGEIRWIRAHRVINAVKMLNEARKKELDQLSDEVKEAIHAML